MNYKRGDGKELSVKDIEKINAYGPYSMAVWKSGDVSVGNEEGLTGRSEYFMQLIRSSILKEFTLEEIKSLSILDIGCNDGWVLHQLSDLPFKKMVGVEPRQKNIDKGKVVRSVLGIENNVDYRLGSIEELNGETFDIVICAGLLYHVESIPLALKNIRAVCDKFLFIESRCISSDYITEELKYEIELRDLVYKYKDEICGLTAQKFESSYYDGSAAVNTIVNLPTPETLIMNLDLLGFTEIDIVAEPSKYRRDVWKDKRPLGGICMTAKVKGLERQTEDDWICSYEKGLRECILPQDIAYELYSALRTEQQTDANEVTSYVLKYIRTNDANFSIEIDNLPENMRDKYTVEILSNMKYSAIDKSTLEYAKVLHSNGNHEEAIEVAMDITSRRLNSDWRSVYRGLDLIAEAFKALGKDEEAESYKRLCLLSNPRLRGISE